MESDSKQSPHPAMQRTWWMNLYPNGQCTGDLCETRESALNKCTYTGEKPDAAQVEVRIVPVPPNDEKITDSRRP